MEWIIRFVAVWILFFLLVDWKELKTNIWCGFFSMALQLSVDTIYITHSYYEIPVPVISVFGSSLFFITGPVFVIGVLIAQFQPHKRWLQVLYIPLLAGIYDIEEYLLLLRKALIYENWHFISSVVFNTAIMMCLSWFSIVVLKRGVKKA